MNNINMEITLNHSPFYDNLLIELQSVVEQKKKILRRVKSKEEIEEKLSFNERKMLKHFLNKESEILMQLVELKGWEINTAKNRDGSRKTMNSYEERDNYKPEFFNY